MRNTVSLSEFIIAQTLAGEGVRTWSLGFGADGSGVAGRVGGASTDVFSGSGF